MADDDFNGQIFVVTPTLAEHLEDADEGKVEKRQGHGPVSSPGVSSRSPTQGARMGCSAPISRADPYLHLRPATVCRCFGRAWRSITRVLDSGAG